MLIIGRRRGYIVHFLVRQKVYLILVIFAGKHPHVFETKWPSLQRFEEERACHTFLRGGLGGVVANGAH